MWEAVSYSRCYFGAMVFALLLNMGTALLRAVGDTRAPALIIASGCVINVALDLVLVAGMGLEALGCGIATAATLCINCCCVVWRLMRAGGLAPRSSQIGNRSQDRAVDDILRPLPLAVQASVYSVSNIIMQSTVNTFGVDAVTGWGLSGRLDAIVWMVTEALGVAITTFFRPELRRPQLRADAPGLPYVARDNRMPGRISSAFLVVFVEPLARLFIQDAAVTAYTARMVHFIAPFYLFYSIVDNTSGVIRGSGRASDLCC